MLNELKKIRFSEESSRFALKNNGQINAKNEQKTEKGSWFADNVVFISAVILGIVLGIIFSFLSFNKIL